MMDGISQFGDGSGRADWLCHQEAVTVRLRAAHVHGCYALRLSGEEPYDLIAFIVDGRRSCVIAIVLF